MRKMLRVGEDHWIGPAILICSANIPVVEPDLMPIKQPNQRPQDKHPKPHRAKIRSKGF